MSKFLVSNFSKKLLTTHNFSTFVRSGKGGKRKPPPPPTDPSKPPKPRSKKQKVAPEQSFDNNASKIRKPRKKPKTFKNTDANGLPLLNSKDCFRRVEFASKMLEILEKDPAILDSIVFSDEGNFMLTPVKKPKSHQTDVYVGDIKDMKSSQLDVLRRYGESKRLPQIVWLGMTSKYIIGPYFFNSYVTDRTYLKMLQSFLIPQLKLLEDGHIDTFWFQQDGNPPHRTRQVLSYLTNSFGPKLISYGCPLMWPPKSQDLTPLDYFLWNHLKDRLDTNCNTHELCTAEGFRRNLIDQIEDTHEHLVKKVVRQFPSRLEKCIEANGERFEVDVYEDP